MTSKSAKINGDQRCAPHISFDNISCIELKIFVEMANAYNKSGSANTIKLYPDRETYNPSEYKKYLSSEIEKRFSDVCTTQKCWTEQDFVKHMKKYAREELEKYTFRPNGPNGKFEWLNTTNIDEVMTQYEKKYTDFKFLGAVPIDFDFLAYLDIKNLNFKKLLDSGISKLGIVFNLDPHDKSGSHWVSMFSDIKKGQIYFFDSYGTPPEPEIRVFIRRIKRFCQLYSGISNVSVDHNKNRWQFGDSECGVYSINFILQLLDGKFFNELCLEKVPDNAINLKRKEYFSNA